MRIVSSSRTRNHTGTVSGRPSGRTVVSHAIRLPWSRASTCSRRPAGREVVRFIVLLTDDLAAVVHPPGPHHRSPQQAPRSAGSARRHGAVPERPHRARTARLEIAVGGLAVMLPSNMCRCPIWASRAPLGRSRWPIPSACTGSCGTPPSRRLLRRRSRGRCRWASADDVLAFMRGTEMAQVLMTGVDPGTAEQAWAAVKAALQAHAEPGGITLAGTAWLLTARRAG